MLVFHNRQEGNGGFVMVKSWFASLKYIVPTDMEYFLEEKAAEGYMLKEVGPMGLFYFEFIEEMSQKCKYVVDVTKLPKSLYMETVMEKDWEYMGRTGNCYIWRQCYADSRPEDFADQSTRKKYCIRIGLLMLLLCIIFLGTIGALIWGIYNEHIRGISIHTAAYIVEAVINIPFAVYFGYQAKRLLTYKEVAKRKKRKAKTDEGTEELDFVKENKKE